MLADRHIQLLTAFVDGEMTRRQRKAVLRLLHRSSEARALLQQLQENAHRLKEMPHLRLPSGFAGQVLQTIAERGLHPKPEPQPVPTRRFPRWTRLAVAAALLVAVAGLAYYLSRSDQPSNPGPITQNLPEVPSKMEINPLVAELLHGTHGNFAARIPEVGLRVAFKDLDSKRDLLAKELRKQTAVHLDVTVRSNGKAVQRLSEVFQRNGVKLVVDARAQGRLKKGQGQVQYLVYAENLRPQEIVDILAELEADDQKGKSSPKSIFESMLVTGFSKEDRQNLSGLLGVDISTFPEAKLFESTVIESPKDKGPKTAPNPARPADRLAVMLANINEGPGGASQEVKMFLAGRKEQRPGTVQVLFVIHQA